MKHGRLMGSIGAWNGHDKVSTGEAYRRFSARFSWFCGSASLVLLADIIVAVAVLALSVL